MFIYVGMMISSNRWTRKDYTGDETIMAYIVSGSA
jgi:hypothetical protein